MESGGEKVPVESLWSGGSLDLMGSPEGVSTYVGNPGSIVGEDNLKGGGRLGRA